MYRTALLGVFILVFDLFLGTNLVSVDGGCSGDLSRVNSHGYSTLISSENELFVLILTNSPDSDDGLDSDHDGDGYGAGADDLPIDTSTGSDDLLEWVEDDCLNWNTNW
jgi:hypothetical protein